MTYLNEPQQPSQQDWKFINELSEPAELYFNWTRSVAKANEADLSSGVEIQTTFPGHNNLETAYDDLNNFFTAAGIRRPGKYKIIIEQTASACFEAYKLDIRADSCLIQANDTEGVRRAVYYLEDMLLAADGPFLRIGVIARKPWLKSRISRCFFGPIKRPPLNRDELMDDVDYYPDEYLNRLAHEGINGLWLTIAFSDLCKTSITELAPDAEKRLEKLRKTVKKCLRYGIKTYIFCIEPRAMAPDNPVLLNNPVLRGAIAWDKKYCFCPSSNVAQKYIYDSTNWIFSQVPGLGGMINISFGERVTTCLSSHFGVTCPVCSKKTPGEIIAAALQPMERGMHAAAPDAELISWLYVPQNGTGSACDEQMLDIADKLPENVILQYNFESSGGKEQLGKYRHAGDYWLSYTGPSSIFARLNEKARARGNAVSAKIQVCCSHEVASVPLVPVPGLLYKKYKAMHELGISHVMQCWYFGNYPGIMNKAAGELAFEEFSDSEEDFLRRLAKPEWGKYTDQVVKAWELFADGYSNYPLDNMFQYYGPMHDGVVWPLHLKPTDLPLAPTWKLEYGTSGDRYGECLGNFSLEEVLTLCAELSGKWNNGMKILRELRGEFKTSKERLKDIALAEALDIQFQSGYNILEFYALRDKLLNTSRGHGIKILNRMRKLVLEEIKDTERMVKLCEADPRLGFHPEAEGYKYFPAKLAWRIKLLKNLIKDDFSQVYERLTAGKKPFNERKLKSYHCNSGKYEYTADFAWKADYSAGKLTISVDDFEKSDASEFGIFLEDKPFYPPRKFDLNKLCEIEIPLSTEADEVGFNIFRMNKLNPDNSCNGWETYHPQTIRLALGHYNPQNKGKLILKKSETKGKKSIEEKLALQI